MKSLDVPLLAALVLAVPLLAGCQKGWLTTYLRERGGTGKSATPLTMINGTDCPDGLARCIGGAIEVSHVARIPRPCSSPAHPEECQCPWEAIDNCPLGCTENGTEVVAPPDRAAARLCAPDPADPPARGVVGAIPPPGACEAPGWQGYRCVGSVVVACAAGKDGGEAPTVLAACVRGCFQEGEALGEEEADPEAATRILCARARATPAK